jgi:hypothetical protein
MAVYHHKSREVAFYQKFFEGAALWADSSKLITPAYDLASRFGLGALDALHAAAATIHNAELVSAEKPTKPIYRAYPNATSNLLKSRCGLGCESRLTSERRVLADLSFYMIEVRKS